MRRGGEVGPDLEPLGGAWVGDMAKDFDARTAKTANGFAAAGRGSWHFYRETDNLFQESDWEGEKRHLS